MKILHDVVTPTDIVWIFWCTRRCNPKSLHSLGCWSVHNNLAPRAMM